jgi:hypothetical protein
MRSRSSLDLAGLALGAGVEGLWCGCLAAAFVAASPATTLWLTAFACAVVLAAALTAGQIAVPRREGAGTGDVIADGDDGDGAGRAAPGDAGKRATFLCEMGLIAASVAVLVLAGNAWAHSSALWVVVRDLVFAGGLVALGARLGEALPEPETAVRRAVRGFVLLCAVLAFAALAGATPAWGVWAVVASLVAGGLLVAVVRHQSLVALVAPAERLPARPWLLAVAGAIVFVVALGALLGQVLRVGVALGALDAVAFAVRYGLAVVAYLVVYAAVEAVRAVALLLSVVHVHLGHVSRVSPAPFQGAALRRPGRGGPSVWAGSRLLFTALGAVTACVLSCGLVFVALRRSRRSSRAAALVVEERESLVSFKAALGLAAARLGRWRRRPRRKPGTPDEVVRMRYADLERRLARAGRPRQPGVTVRDYLAAVSTAPAGEVSAGDPVVTGQESPAGLGGRAVVADGPPLLDTPPIEASSAPPIVTATDLAAIYERARYSGHAVDAAQARLFEGLARAFMA